VSTTGAGGKGSVYDEAISGDGRWAGFASRAGNLVPHDTNKAFDIFVHGPLSP
jgi:hypothetical protein